MASRAKKKASATNLSNDSNVTPSVTNNPIDKWGKIHLATTIVALVVLFFLIMLSPTIYADIKMSITGSESDATEQEFNVTSLDAMFAPIRGCNEGFRFLLEKMGAKINSDKEYQNLIELISPLLEKDAVEKTNKLGVMVMVLSYLLLAFYIASVTLNVLDIKMKKKAMLSTVGSGLFLSMATAYLICAIAINTNTIFESSKINASWGIWLIFLITITQFAINIATWVNGSKRKENENL